MRLLPQPVTTTAAPLPGVPLIRHRAPSGVQSKLSVTQPGDVFEREADHVAAQVMQTTSPNASAHARQALATPAQSGALPADWSGQALDSSARAFLEPRMGHDFAHVRVHTDAAAAQSARALGASAYTIGRDIVFGAGQYRPDQSQGRALLAHELTHVVQQSGASAPMIARDGPVTEDVSKLDAEPLEKRMVTLNTWFNLHLTDDAEYQTKLQAAVDLFNAAALLKKTPASAQDITDLKARLVAASPRTAFELKLRKNPANPYKAVHDKSGQIVGYSRSSGGYTEVLDIEGNIVKTDEIPLETPLIDPIDLIPFELLGSLTVKAATIGGRALVKAGIKVLAKDAAKVVVEEGVKLGTKEVVGEAARIGAKELPKVAAKEAAGEAGKVAASETGKVAASDASKVVASDASKTGAKALVEVFRKGTKLKSAGVVSLNRLRQVLGRAGVSPSKYKLVKVPADVVAAMEKESGEVIWGWISRTGSGVATDASGRPIINFTPRALSSLKEAVKTFGHEAKHIKDFAAGLTTSSEALAEREGEKLWLVVMESLGVK